MVEFLRVSIEPDIAYKKIRISIETFFKNKKKKFFPHIYNIQVKLKYSFKFKGLFIYFQRGNIENIATSRKNASVS